MKVGVIGTGYVGLVTGVCFSEIGNDVICADVDTRKIEMLMKGQSPIYEPGLTELLQKNVTSNRLSFTTDVARTIRESEIVFIAVGTPSDKDGSADLRYVLDVAAQVGANMNGHKTVVVKSTVPVGTCLKVKDAIQKRLNELGSKATFDIVSNPEFLKEGTAIEDCMRPSRVIVGAEHEEPLKVMDMLYAPLCRGEKPLIKMDLLSSEMTKYAANAMLATKISFMNEVSQLCERVGANVENVRRGIGSDPRIGHHFIFPGIGYGGSCFPKDVRALVQTAHAHDCQMRIISAAEEANLYQRKNFFEKISNYYRGELKGLKFAVWGLAFKPQTDDVREAPALDLIEYLTKRGATVCAHDPIAIHSTQLALGHKPGVEYTPDQYAVLNGADCLVVVTEWLAFRKPDWNRVSGLLKNQVIFDGRNLYQPSEMQALGYDYISIGRAPVEVSKKSGLKRAA